MARTGVKVESRPVQRPAKIATPRRWPAAIERIVIYLREVLVELKRVEWPSRREATSATIVVLLVLLALAFYLGAFDYLYTVMVKRWLVRPTV